MNILVTGGSGFVGQALIPKLLAKGERVISVSRNPQAPRENLMPLVGDITKPNLGLSDVAGGKIEKLYHLAAIHTLGKDKNGLIWETNVDGTRNVIDFCIRYDVPHLLFCSTAYTSDENPYERSKIVSEREINTFAKFRGVKATIFKPSVIMGTEGHPFPGHFSQFVYALIRFLRIAGVVKSKIEGVLRLPVLEIVHRVQGNPEGRLNLVTVDKVARAMADIDDEGVFWLTNPNPPLLRDLAKWVSEFIMIDFRIVPEFEPTPIEARFMRVASAFKPYLEGDSFPSDMSDCPPVTKEFIHDTIRTMFLRG
ncbi:hypothetical protein ES707_15870 [subsurface metagenome]